MSGQQLEQPRRAERQQLRKWLLIIILVVIMMIVILMLAIFDPSLLIRISNSLSTIPTMKINAQLNNNLTLLIDLTAAIAAVVGVFLMINSRQKSPSPEPDKPIEPQSPSSASSQSRQKSPPPEPDKPIEPIDPPQPPPREIFLPRAPLQHADNFHGREQERRQLIENTKRKTSTAIIGRRSIGKSWLMQYLLLVAPTKLGHNFRVGHLYATAAGCSTVDKFVREALNSLDYVDSDLGQAELTLATLDIAIRSLRLQSITSVLCIDEFEKFIEFGAEFISQLNASVSKGLVMIVICKKSLDTYLGRTNDLCENFELIKLQAFTDEEALSFVKQKSAEANFTEEEKSRFEAYTKRQGGRIPVNLQDYGEKVLLRRINTDQHSTMI